MACKHLMTALLGSALLSAPALAQTQSPTQPTQPASPNASPATGSNAAPSAMPAGNWMTQERPDQWRASRLEGLDVYNNNNEKVGDISELLVDQNGKIEAVVIGVGGFLGIGEHNVAVPFDQIKFVNEPRAAATAANTAPPGAAGTAPGTAGNAPATTGSTTTTTPAAPADTMNRSAPDHALLNMTKDQLKAAPEFKYSR